MEFERYTCTVITWHFIAYACIMRQRLNAVTPRHCSNLGSCLLALGDSDYLRVRYMQTVT